MERAWSSVAPINAAARGNASNGSSADPQCGSHPPIPCFMMLPLDTVTGGGSECSVALQPWFKQALALLTASGVHGVAVDVWWGAVEHQPGVYSWAGYKQLVELVQQAGLKIQAVMSFHACGGNTGDTASISLPPWVLACAEQDPDLFFNDMPRSSSSPNSAATAEGRNREYISLWASDEPVLCGRTAYQCYEDFMTSFRNTFALELGSVIEEVVVGSGPCGELRYPSYPEARGWRFPGVGEFQCYDSRALLSLEAAALEAGMPRWGLGGPHDAGHYNTSPEETGFFADAGSWDTPYGRFFLNWYSGSLLRHGDRLLASATKIFGVTTPNRLCLARQATTPLSDVLLPGQARPYLLSQGSAPPPGPPYLLSASPHQHGPGADTEATSPFATAAMAVMPRAGGAGTQGLGSPLLYNLGSAGQGQLQTVQEATAMGGEGSNCSGGSGSDRTGRAVGQRIMFPGPVRVTGLSVATSQVASAPPSFVLLPPEQTEAAEVVVLPSGMDDHPFRPKQLMTKSTSYVQLPPGSPANARPQLHQHLLVRTSSNTSVSSVGAGSMGHPAHPPPHSYSMGSSLGAAIGSQSNLAQLVNVSGMVRVRSNLNASQNGSEIGGGGPCITSVGPSTTLVGRGGAEGQQCGWGVGPASAGPTTILPANGSWLQDPSGRDVRARTSATGATPSIARAASSNGHAKHMQGETTPRTRAQTILSLSPLDQGQGANLQYSPIGNSSQGPKRREDTFGQHGPGDPLTLTGNRPSHHLAGQLGRNSQDLSGTGMPGGASMSDHLVVPVRAMRCSLDSVLSRGESWGEAAAAPGAHRELLCSSLGALKAVRSLAAPFPPDLGSVGMDTAAHAAHAPMLLLPELPQPVNLALKIPGVHWWFRSNSHAAELTAGYHNTATHDGYAAVVELCARYGVALTLTCVEMCDAQHPPGASCSPEGLLKQVRALTARYGVQLNGENALPVFALPNGPDTVALDRVVINSRAWYGPKGAAAAQGRHCDAWPSSNSQPTSIHRISGSVSQPGSGVYPVFHPHPSSPHLSGVSHHPHLPQAYTQTALNQQHSQIPASQFPPTYDQFSQHSWPGLPFNHELGGHPAASGPRGSSYELLPDGWVQPPPGASQSQAAAMLQHQWWSTRGSLHGSNAAATAAAEELLAGIVHGGGSGLPAGMHVVASTSSLFSGRGTPPLGPGPSPRLPLLHKVATNGSFGMPEDGAGSALGHWIQPALSQRSSVGALMSCPHNASLPLLRDPLHTTLALQGQGLGLPGEQSGVAACGLRTDGHAAAGPLPPMRSFTFLRLSPELLKPACTAQWLRFMACMQQGGYEIG